MRVLLTGAAGPRPLSPRTVGALTGYLALTAVHLLAQSLDAGPLAGPLADVTQALLMPALALAVLAATSAPRSRLVRLTLLALGFSWLGDSVPRLLAGDAAFAAMVGAFLLAQVTYAVAFWPDAGRGLLARRRGWLTPYAVALVALMAACLPHAGVLAVPVLLYGCCLVAMAVLATGVHPLAWIGAAVFAVSDGLIALGAFAPGADLPGADVLVMTTYAAAQGLMALGVLARDRTGDRMGAPAPAPLASRRDSRASSAGGSS